MKNLAEKIAAVRARRARCQAMLEQLDETGEDQISLTDPDSRAMAAHTRVAVGYNVQIAVDAKHKLIVEQQVTNQVVDMGLLTETATRPRRSSASDGSTVVADSGYFKIEDIEACEKAGMTPYVPRPQRGPAVRAGLFRKDEFRYDPASDSVLCPAGHRLEAYTSSVIRGLKKVNYGNKEACRDCPLRARCTKGQFRTVSRLENEAVLDRMQDRLAKRPDILDRRREVVGASVRLHQAVDEPGCLPDARLRERARRVQPDGARLQSPAGAQSGRVQGSAGGRGGLRAVCGPRF